MHVIITCCSLPSSLLQSQITLWYNDRGQNPLWEFYPELFLLLRMLTRTHPGGSTENPFIYILQGFHIEIHLDPHHLKHG